MGKNEKLNTAESSETTDEKQNEKKSGQTKKTKRVSYKKLAKKYEKENEELKDKLLRTAAEFDNFKKRTERDYLSISEKSKENIILKVVPFLDDLDRSLNAVNNNNNNTEGFIAGVQMIRDKFIKTLEIFGVKQFSAVGEQFNVERHEALMSIEKEGVKSNTIVDEHEKGYLLNDKVIRHAKVIVSK